MKTTRLFPQIILMVILLMTGTMQTSKLTAQNCIANYTASVNNVSKTVTFTNTSTGAGTYFYFWNFGDNTTSTQASPTKVYNTYGKFRVCLTVVKSDSTCYNTKCDSIAVTSTCNPDFTYTIDPTNYRKINVTAGLNDTNYTYSWTFGGTSGQSVRSTSFTFPADGNYIVTLTVTKKDQSCSNVSSKTIAITGSPCTTTVTKTVSGNNYKSIYFVSALTDTANFNFLWFFGDNTSATGRVVNHTYANDGHYCACLKVTKKDSSCFAYMCDSVIIASKTNTSCTSTVSRVASQTNYKSYTFTAGLTDTANYWFYWAYGDGSYATGRLNYHTYTNPGHYYTCLKVTRKDSSCTAYMCDSLIITATNTCTTTVSKGADPSNYLKINFEAALTDTTNYTFQWFFGDNLTGSGRNTSHIYGKPGHYYACLKVMKKDTTCFAYMCDSVIINTPNTCSTTVTKTVSGNNYKSIYFVPALTDTANYWYTWAFGDGSYGSGRVVNHTYAANGVYYACLKVSKKDSSCFAYMCDSVRIGSICTTTFSNARDAVNGNKWNFEATLNSTDYYYHWTLGDNLSSNDRVVSHTYATSGTYTVCLTVTKKDSSCTATRCSTIVSAPYNQGSCHPGFNFSISDTVNANHQNVRFTNTSTGNTSSFWSFGDGSYSFDNNVNHHYAAPGQYLACLTIYQKTNNDTTCTNTICKLVDTNLPVHVCHAIFSYNHAVASTTVNFVSRSTGANLSYYWTFDGTSHATTATPSFTFNNFGTHQVCLKVVSQTDTTCQETHCEYMILNQNAVMSTVCQPGFSASEDNLSKGLFQFQSYSGSNSTTNWNFGDGAYSPDANPVHQFTKAGTYVVCLSSFNPIDSCSFSYCDSVLVNAVSGIAAQAIQLGAVYPVPMQQLLHIDLVSKVNGSGSIRLFDINGKLLIEREAFISKGKQSLELNTDALSSGLYLLDVMINDQHSYKKVIK